MNLPPVPTDPHAWIMGLMVLLFIPSLAFFMAREFKDKDRFFVALRELNASVSALTKSVDELKLWSTERFVTRVEHHDDISSIKDHIAHHAAYFEREMDKCQERNNCDDRTD